MTSELLQFPREIGLKRMLCGDLPTFRRYIRALNGKSSIYTSVYSFGGLLDNRVDEGKVIIDRAWWDFDATNRHSIENVKTDTAVLINRLDGDVRVVATGRGFHVHQLFSSPVNGRSWANTLDRYQRLKAEGLESLDGVSYPRKICRVPNTYNPKRKRWCVVIDGKAFANNPLTYSIPKRPDAALNAMHPYLGDSAATNAFNLAGWAALHPLEIESRTPLGAVIRNIDDGIEGVPMPPCLQQNISVANPSHHVRVALVQHLAENLRWFVPAASLSIEQLKDMENSIVGFIRTLEWQDFNERVTRNQTRSLLKYDRVPSCAWFMAREMCPGPCWRHDGSANS